MVFSLSMPDCVLITIECLDMRYFYIATNDSIFGLLGPSIVKLLPN